MENHECCKLWEKADGARAPQALRRPKPEAGAAGAKPDPEGGVAAGGFESTRSATVSESRPTTQQQQQQQPFQLRADAAEWFPHGYVRSASSSSAAAASQSQSAASVASPSSVQDRLRRYKEGAAPDEDASEEAPRVRFDAAKARLILQSLTYDPGQFDRAAGSLREMLEPHFQDLEVSESVADMIFRLALREASFRYNGARLCSFIDADCPMFRARLHLLCEKEMQEMTNPQGLTLFLAELYMQLNYESVYGKSLMMSIENLLKLGKDDNIKCVCQTLKLSGYLLDKYHSSELDEIFKKLEAFKPKLSQSLANLLESTVNLRKNQWGRSGESATQNSTQDQNGYETSGEIDSLLYSSDGPELTSEEHDFLCANLALLGDETSDPDELYDPEPEMDAEIQEAFREFVKLGKR